MDQLLSDFYLWVGFQPYTWLWLLVGVSLFDAATTAYSIIKLNGRESNIVMAWFMGKIGVIQTLVITKSIHIIITYYLIQQNILYLPLWVGIFFAIAMWNLSGIYRSKKVN